MLGELQKAISRLNSNTLQAPRRLYFSRGGTNPPELLDLADKALYEAKLKGKNGVVLSREVFGINKDKDVEDESNYSSNK